MCFKLHSHGRLLAEASYGKENGMERKFWYGIWKMPESNGRYQKCIMKDNFLFFHNNNSELEFAHGIYRKIYADSVDN